MSDHIKNVILVSFFSSTTGRKNHKIKIRQKINEIEDI
jgi:hypothetical protein